MNDFLKQIEDKWILVFLFGGAMIFYGWNQTEQVFNIAMMILGALIMVLKTKALESNEK